MGTQIPIDKLKRERRTAANYIREVLCARYGEIAQLANKAGIPPGHLRGLLRQNGTKCPNLATARKLRPVTGLPLDVLQDMHRPVRDVVRDGEA